MLRPGTYRKSLDSSRCFRMLGLRTLRHRYEKRMRICNGRALPYSDIGYTYQNNCIDSGCGTNAGQAAAILRQWVYISNQALRSFARHICGDLSRQSEFTCGLLALGLGASINTELESHPLRQYYL